MSPADCCKASQIIREQVREVMGTYRSALIYIVYDSIGRISRREEVPPVKEGVALLYMGVSNALGKLIIEVLT